MDTAWTVTLYHPNPESSPQPCASLADQVRLLRRSALWRPTPHDPQDPVWHMRFYVALKDASGKETRYWTFTCDEEVYKVYWLAMQRQGTPQLPHYGPFAYCPFWARRRRVMPARDIVVAQCDLHYHGWDRVKGEAFRLFGWESDRQLWEEGLIARPLEGTQPLYRYKHPQTARFFPDEEAFQEYAMRYEEAIDSGLVPAAVDLPAQRGREKGSGTLLENLPWEVFFEDLKRAATKALARYTGKTHPNSAAIAEAYGPSRETIRRKLAKHGRTWKSVYPLLFPDYFSHQSPPPLHK